MNDSIYTLSCLPRPPWAKRFDQQSWNRLGVVVWDTQTQRITHLFGSQAMRILEGRGNKGLEKERISCRRICLSDHYAGGQETER